MTIASALRDQALARPDHPAIEIADRQLSYNDVLQRCEDSAARLAQAGLKSGDLIGVRLPDSAEHLILLFAIARLGGILMSLSPRDPDGELQRNIAGLKFAALITQHGKGALDGIRSLDVAAFCPSSPSELLTFDGAVIQGSHPYTCGQSSGTTGKPKTILWSHRLYLRWGEVHAKRGNWLNSDRMALLIQLCFGYGRAIAMSTLCHGGTLQFPVARDMPGALAEIRARDTTLLYLTPAHMRTALAVPMQTEPSLPALRGLFLGTAALTPGERVLARARLSPHLFENYGTNETGPLAYATPDQHDAYPDAVGQVLDDIDVQVVGPDERPLANGEVGLVRFRNRAFPTGYLGNPQASEQHFRDGWFYPGDLAALNDERFLFLRGRADDVIENQGTKYYPAEVEEVLLSHPAITDAAVIPWRHPRHGNVAVAFITVRSGEKIESLPDFCRERLASHKCPFRFFALDTLPRNAMGKVQKHSLRDFLDSRLSDQGRPADL